MLFEVKDTGLQRQIDLVCEELREVSIMEELFFSRSEVMLSCCAEYLQQEEKNIRKRISFLESLRARAALLQAEVGKDMDEVLQLMSSTDK